MTGTATPMEQTKAEYEFAAYDRAVAMEQQRLKDSYELVAEIRFSFLLLLLLFFFFKI